MSWRTFTHHALKGGLRSVQVFFFVVVPAVILWLQFVGLPTGLHAPVIKAAAQEGLDLKFSAMRVSIFQGLVLDDVRLSAKNLPEKSEIAVDRASLAVNWRELLRGKFELGALELRGAQLYLPVATKDGVTRSLRLTRARARLALADGVVSVPLARFNLQGIEVTATGQIALSAQAPQAPQGEILPPEAARAIEILESVEFGNTPPKLSIEFSAAGGTSGTWQIPVIRFEAPRASYGAIALRDIRVEGEFIDRVFNLRRLAASDGKGGSLEGAGQWNAATGEAQAQLESSLDPAGFVSEFFRAKELQDIAFRRPPVIRATLEASKDKPRRLQLLGTAESGDFTYRGLKFGGFSAGFVWREGGEFYADNISLRTPSGPITAAVMKRPGIGVRMRLDCQADPLPLLPLLGTKAKESVNKMELKFLEPPRIKLEAEGPKFDPAALQAKGTLQLGKTSIHGSPMDNASADVSFENLALTLSNMRVKRPEGSGSGSFTYDFGQRLVRLENVRSTMMPFNVLQWADPTVARETEPYRLKGPPDVTVNGVIGLQDSSLTALTAQFSASQGLDYDLLDRTLNFGAARGTLRFEGKKILVDIPSAQLFGGNTKINAAIATGQPGARQQMTVDLERVNFETLTRLYFDYRDSKGLVSGRYNFSFVPGQPEMMRGEGNLLVEDGNVFAIPVLGPLSFLLDSVIPGAGYQTSRRATCDYTVAKGEIRTDNLDVQGQGFVMIGKGSLFFIEDRMDFAVRVNAQGVPGILLYPVSKLFEYVSDGKMTEPKWRPRMLPKNDRSEPGKRKEEKSGPPSAEAKPNGRA